MEIIIKILRIMKNKKIFNIVVVAKTLFSYSQISNKHSLIININEINTNSNNNNNFIHLNYHLNNILVSNIIKIINGLIIDLNSSNNNSNFIEKKCNYIIINNNKNKKGNKC